MLSAGILLVLILASSKGATIPSWYVPGIRYRFNPRSREGSDVLSLFYKQKQGVSIHAPARGTTVSVNVASTRSIVSIHVPARGTTCSVSIPGEQCGVSIHVPARGTTFEKGVHMKTIKFQSTFPQGERHDERKEKTIMALFQSTFPQGERHFLVHLILSS